VEKSVFVNKDTRVRAKPLDLNFDIYKSDNYVVLDFETTNRSKGSPSDRSNSLVLACWMVGPGHPSYASAQRSRVLSQFGTEYEQQRLIADIEKADFLVAFNAKFECGWLLRCGVELRDLIVYDPMLAEYVLAGNIKPRGGYGLDSTLERYKIPGKMRYVSALIESGVCPSTIPSRELERYCSCDVLRTQDLFVRQRPRVYNASLHKVLYGRCLQSPMLADVESRGVYLDSDRVRVLSQSKVREYQGLDRQLQLFCGAVNWNSPKQIGELIYDRLGFEEVKDYRGNVVKTDSGGRSASDPTISLLVAGTDQQREFKRLWGALAPLKKEVSILETMGEICDEADGHFFATFNQAIAGNHRLTSTGGKYGLQLQNQPRAFKSLFRPRDKGRKIIEGDCPQLEFRTGIDLSNDPVGCSDILARADVHSLTSSVTGFNRQDAKPHTFKPMYGGRSGPPKLRKYYEAFRKRYNVLYDTQTGWTYQVLEHKQLKTATGLVFYWPDTEVKSGGFITNTPQIFNYPISMFATADISQLSLLLAWHNTRDIDADIVNTIHDSGVWDVAEEAVDKVTEVVVQSYTRDIYDVLATLYGYNFHTPLGISIKCGERWGEGEERAYENEERFKFTSPTKTAIRLGVH
jgi:hypothetical protein